MAELKTKLTGKNVEVFINKITDPKRKADCVIINEMFKKITKREPRMWGEAIIGYGDYHYKYASGREGEWFPVGFSPRKQNITLYSMCGFDKNQNLLEKLGKYKTGKSCLYINKLEDVDLKILEKIYKELFNSMKIK